MLHSSYFSPPLLSSPFPFNFPFRFCVVQTGKRWQESMQYRCVRVLSEMYQIKKQNRTHAVMVFIMSPLCLIKYDSYSSSTVDIVIPMVILADRITRLRNTFSSLTNFHYLGLKAITVRVTQTITAN